MHERTDVEDYLKEKAKEISEELPEKTDVNGEPPVVVVVPGTGDGPKRTSTASDGLNRLRDLLGTLETAKEIESKKHFDISPS